MKRTLWNITLASVITLVAYIALSFIWGAILGRVEDQTLRFSLIALMTTIAYGFFLVYTSKIRNSVGEDEIMSDYKDGAYVSPIDDFKRIIQRELKTLICIAVIVLACFVINTIERAILEKETDSLLTFIFAPLCFFSTAISVPGLGYIISAILDCVAYIIFLLLFRKKKYNYWMKNKM